MQSPHQVKKSLYQQMMITNEYHEVNYDDIEPSYYDPELNNCAHFIEANDSNWGNYF